MLFARNRKNSHDEQKKIIKHGHLVGNMLIFMNVHDQSKKMNQFIREGHVIIRLQAACLAQFRVVDIKLFRVCFLDELGKSINVD